MCPVFLRVKFCTVAKRAFAVRRLMELLFSSRHGWLRSFTFLGCLPIMSSSRSRLARDEKKK